METKELAPSYVRLRKLAFHLLEGKLGHEDFDFGRWNEGGEPENPCGTQGCAIGECPIVFPSSWKFVQNYYDNNSFLPALKFRKFQCSTDVFDDIKKFFGVSWEEAKWLFASSADTKAPWNTNYVTRDANRYEVAASILSYIAWKKAVLKGTIR